MANRTLTADVIAKEALMILDNNCVMGGLVHRGYEEEFKSNVNGYKKGETISIRRPVDFTVRDGAVADVQDTQEGKFSLTIDKQKGVDFRFSSTDLTLKIEDLSERIIKPAMVQIANQIDRDVMALYKNVWNWVGTPGATPPGALINSYSDFALGPQRLDEGAVPGSDRSAVLSPANAYAMLGSQTGLYMQDVAKDAYRKNRLGMIANCDTYSSQNVPVHLNGAGGTNEGDILNAAGTTWEATRDTGYQDIATNQWGTGETILEGDVFTIDGVYAVNPVTKATLSFLQPFVVRATVVTNGTASSETTLRISPPIIASGAHQTVSAVPQEDATITRIGSETVLYDQNMIFHKNAFALCMVPMESPPGAVDVARRSYKGWSVRVIPYYDGTNDVSNWRLDVLYGTKTLDARLATRISGGT